MGNIVFFDWDKIFKHTGGVATRILDIMEDPRKRVKFTGKSFITGLEPIISYRFYSYKHRADYIGLCSLRNWADYYMFNDSTLDRRFTNMTDDALRENPLVSLEGGRIKLKWEN